VRHRPLNAIPGTSIFQPSQNPGRLPTRRFGVIVIARRAITTSPEDELASGLSHGAILQLGDPDRVRQSKDGVATHHIHGRPTTLEPAFVLLERLIGSRPELAAEAHAEHRAKQREFTRRAHNVNLDLGAVLFDGLATVDPDSMDGPRFRLLRAARAGLPRHRRPRRPQDRRQRSSAWFSTSSAPPRRRRSRAASRARPR
jgi:hypothetical protein